MALKLKLKPREQVFLSGALVKNGSSVAEFEVLNEVPLLREKDILLEGDADTTCKKLYLIVQTMYFDPTKKLECFQLFSELAIEVIRAAPTTIKFLEVIHPLVSDSKYYAALKETQKLIQYEDQLLSNAKQAQ